MARRIPLWSDGACNLSVNDQKMWKKWHKKRSSDGMWSVWVQMPDEVCRSVEADLSSAEGNEGDGGNDVNNEWMSIWPQWSTERHFCTFRPEVREFGFWPRRKKYLSLDYECKVAFGSGSGLSVTLGALNIKWIWKTYRTQHFLLCKRSYKELWKNVSVRKIS